MSFGKDFFYRGLGGAVAVHLVLAASLALQRPGVEYDEALLAHGAVQMLSSPAEPRFAHDHGSWIPVAGRFFPLMVIPYIGAVKHYLALVPVAVFGPDPLVLRLLSSALAALGFIGLAVLLRDHVGPAIALAAAWALAVHPAYLDLTVFDNSGLAVWMGCLGLIALALAAYLRHPGRLRALALGIACGLAVWGRLNFVWFLASVALAALLAAGRSALPPRRHWVPYVLGGVLGGAPLLAYELVSRFATLRFIDAFSLTQGRLELLPRRLHLLIELLVSDEERRRMWGGAPVSTWQLVIASVAFAVAIAVALWPSPKDERQTGVWARGLALATVLYLALMLSSRLNVLQHHLVTVLPLAVTVLVLAGARLARHVRALRPVVALTGCVLMAVWLGWNVAAANGLRRTRGVDTWSDAIYSLAADLERNAPNGEVTVLDWGFGNNLFFISDAAVRPIEAFWGASEQTTGTGEPWSAIVARGGFFVTGGGRPSAFAAASSGFQAALAESGARYTMKRYTQRSGAMFAELYEVAPALAAEERERQ